MGLQPYYTISASLLLKQFKPEDPVIRNNRLNIFFSSESEFIPHLYTILCELTNGYVFSVADSLIKNTQTLAELLPKLFLLTTINMSAKGEKKVPLFLTNAKESLDIDTIKLYFAQQGIPDIAF